jgi:hypothetical protein
MSIYIADPPDFDSDVAEPLSSGTTVGCEAKVVIDPVLVADMLDLRRLLDGYNSGLCNASRLAEADEELGVLRLGRVSGSQREGGHFALDRE